MKGVLLTDLNFEGKGWLEALLGKRGKKEKLAHLQTGGEIFQRRSITKKKKDAE